MATPRAKIILENPLHHRAMRELDLARDAAAKTIDRTAPRAVELAASTAASVVGDTDAATPSSHARDVMDTDEVATQQAKVLNEFVQYLTTVLEIKNPTRLVSLAQAFVWNRDDALVDDFVAEGFNVVLYAKRAISPPVKCSPIVTKKPAPPPRELASFHDKRRQRPGSINDLTVRQIRLLQSELEKEAKAREGSPVAYVPAATVTPSPSHLSLDLLDKYVDSSDDVDMGGAVKKRKVTPEPDNAFVE